LTELRELGAQAGSLSNGNMVTAANKLMLCIKQARRIDFFDAPGYEALEKTMQELD
jgi:hypothetical protein